MGIRRSENNSEMDYLISRPVPELSASALSGNLLSVSRLTKSTDGYGLTGEHVQEDAFLLSMQLRDYKGTLSVDGSSLDFRGGGAGTFTLYDYSRVWSADLQSSFDCVNFYISRRALLTLEEEIGSKKFRDFNIAPGVNMNDPVVSGIVSSMLPFFDGQHQVSQLMLDYVGAGLIVHLLSTYGNAQQSAVFKRGGLTHRQLRRAKDLLVANITGAASLSEIAGECGLSLSYFSRAFKVSTGQSPYKWLLDHRIEIATDLLKNSTLSLGEIAARCGFSDQAHFTRTFGTLKGLPPLSWRKSEQKFWSIPLKKKA
jgi:AraC-like DNA-binding protein